MVTAKHVLMALLLNWCCIGTTFAQSVGDIIEGVRIVDELFKDDSDPNCQDPPAGAETDSSDWATEWRTSEQEGENSTQYRHQRDLPPGCKRIGCICMDGTEQDDGGRGSCSGHGGVRQWVYVTPDGERIEQATERHYQHPEALSEDEKNQLAAYNEADKKAPNSTSTNAALVQLAMIVMVCSTVAFAVKQMWN